MTTRKASEKEIKINLINDAKAPNAWGKPITVAASGAPRPDRYGQSGHLQLAAKFYVLSLLHFLGCASGSVMLNFSRTFIPRSVAILQ